jgi:hypothetical protein
MSNPVKVSIIIAVAIIIATGMWIYFSPFHTCIRAMVATGQKEPNATVYCATLNVK